MPTSPAAPANANRTKYPKAMRHTLKDGHDANVPASTSGHHVNKAGGDAGPAPVESKFREELE